MDKAYFLRTTFENPLSNFYYNHIIFSYLNLTIKISFTEYFPWEKTKVIVVYILYGTMAQDS